MNRYDVSIRGDLDELDRLVFSIGELDGERVFSLTGSTIDGDIILYADDLTKDDLFELLHENIVSDILNFKARPMGNGVYEISDIIYNQTMQANINLSNVEAVNKLAKKMSKKNGYSAYLLVDGSLIFFQDHAEISSIPNMTPNKFIALGNIRLGYGGTIELIKRPTYGQFMKLMSFIGGRREIYIDFAEESDSFYPHVILGKEITHPSAELVCDLIQNFFDGRDNMNEVMVIPKGTLFENVTDEVNSSEVDLSSFALRDELFPGFWSNKDGLLNSRIRLKLLDIADDFWKTVNLSWVKPNAIILTGSICNYNWSTYSDIDLHLIVDFSLVDKHTDFVRDYFNSKKNEWNDMHNHLSILGRNVELYVQNMTDDICSGGIYDLEQNKWLQKPIKNSDNIIERNEKKIKETAAEIMTIIDGMHIATDKTTDKHQIESIGDDAYKLWRRIKSMRSDSLNSDGENGKGNIIYKILRRTQYLDKLFELMSYTYDEVNSIEEGKEKNNGILLEYLDNEYNYPLYRYFKWAASASPCELAEDLAYHNSYMIPRFFKRIAEELDDEDEFDDGGYIDDERIDKFIQNIQENGLCQDFIDFCQDYGAYYGEYNELPSWMTMDFKGLVKNQWCIHFTSDADNIAKYGFTGGTEEIDSLAYTEAGQEKDGEGYDFAFLINDRSVDFNSYGDEAVIFRTSGVEVYHYGDEQNQVVFWGRYAKDFIPIYLDYDDDEWKIYGRRGQVLMSGTPSELAQWATNNVAQYRRQILFGKNGRKNYQESIDKYLGTIKLIKEEIVADGDSDHNPYAKRWDAERQALKDFICKYGKLMTSKENGKTYKVYYDKTLSELIGYNYCICLQWDAVKREPSSIIYIRALDKLTERMFQANFDPNIENTP